MRRIAFSKLLLILVLLPLAAAALLAGALSYDSWSRYDDLTRASSLLRLAAAAARFSGLAIPAEGAASRAAVAGADNAAALDQQRRFTDERYRALREAASGNLIRNAQIDAHLRAIDKQMQAILALRAQIDAKQVSTPQATTAVLAPAAGRAIDLVGTAAAIASDAVLSRRITGLYATLQFNDSALIQRGAIELALTQGRVPPDMYLLLARSAGLNATFRKLFEDFAPPEVVALFAAFDGREGRALEELRALALANSGTPASEADRARWRDLSGELTAVLSKVVTATADDVSLEAAQLVDEAWRHCMNWLGIMVAVLAIAIAVSRMVVATVRDLLGELAATMQALCNRQHDIRVPGTDRSDQIGVMARAAESFRQNLMRMDALEREQKEGEARSAEERKAAMRSLASRFEEAVSKIVDGVSATSAELESAAGMLTRSAEGTHQLSAAAADASKRASTNVDSVASATGEMTSSITEISRQVQESSRIAADAVAQAGRTDSRVSKLSRAADRIGEVVKLISAIAEQTNLLALNATIEAARAGAAGKGFAVVAQEVKALATPTAKATAEIGTQISEIQAATHDSVGAIKDISTTIQRISEIAAAIAAAVEEQGAVTQEIASNIVQAARRTSELAQNLDSVNRGAADTGSASARMLASTQSLTRQSGSLKAEVTSFLKMVRA